MRKGKTNKKSALKGKRVTAFLLVCLMAFLLAGCGNGGEGNNAKKDFSGSAPYAAGISGDESTTSESAPMEAPAGGEVSGDGEGVQGDIAANGVGMDGAADDGDSMDDLGEGGISESEESFSDDVAMEAKMNSYGGEEITIDPHGDENYQPKAGTLTAGAWDDNENWGYYRNLFAPSSDYYSYKTSWGMNFENRIRVKVTDVGKPVNQAKVSLLDEGGSLIWGSVSRYDGYADVFYATDKNNTKKPAAIKAEKDGIVKEMKLTEKKITHPYIYELENGQGGREIDGGQEFLSVDYEFEPEYEIELTGTKEGKKSLDLMFVVDTTGSMSDEISFLQTELKDVINSVKKNNSGLPVRISLNFYKDEGDNYIVDSHKFTDSVEEAQSLINNEYASGGGDFPEAVDRAVYDGVVSHSWDEDSTKIMFLLLDAPPHAGGDVNEKLSESLMEAGKKGIRIIPVAASGIDKQTEFLLRAMSISTDGTYVFLTDDSGVGNSHIEPTIGDYDVELLNELMVRLINQYLG